MSRSSALSLSFALTASLLVAPGCGKSGKDDKAEAKNPPVTTTPVAEQNGDLEKAINATGPKTVTAIGSDGKTQVLELGKMMLAETETYLVKAEVPAEVAAGSAGAVTIDLTPKPGWKINQEFPTKLKVVAPDGVTLTAESQGMSEAVKFTEKAAQFKVDFQAVSAGDKAFSASFRFAVCTDSTCDPKSADLAWNLVVK